jgi:hypothetical protein
MQKRKGAEMERGRNGKRHKGKRHNSFCFISESGIKERGIFKKIQNKKGA